MLDGTKILNKAMKPKIEFTNMVNKQCYICKFNKDYQKNQNANCPYCNQPLRTHDEWRELEFQKLKKDIRK
jgi:hypothetical protein